MSVQNQDSFTRGSQIYAHKLRMLAQGAKNSGLVSLILVIGWLLWRVLEKLSLSTIYYFIIERYLQLKLDIGQHFYPLPQIGIRFYHLRHKGFIYCNAGDFIDKFWHKTIYGAEITDFWSWFLNSGFREMLIVFVIGLFAAIIFFMQRGKEAIGTNKTRGMDFVPLPELVKMIKKAGKASSITIGGLPLVKGTETQHMLITGAVGAGKTNLLNELLPQIRQQKERAIIVDLTGTFVETFFNPEIDKLLNPFESNTQHWLPWNDCEQDFEFDALASAFVDGESFSDKYWEEAAQKVLSVALQKQSQTKSLNLLLDIIAKASLSDFCRHFEGSFAAGLVSKEGEKGTASVRATLLNKIERLKYLKNGGDFSIKSWVNSGEGWLFITAPPNQRDTLRPLVSAWLDIAIKGLMDRSPKAANQKMWFILDELPALQKIPSLKRGLAEGRKYGGCFVAGIQNIFQMEEIYGSAGGSSILDLFSTKVIFRVGDQQTAQRSAAMLGEQETMETQENLSYGANSIRDGVNINTVEKKRLLVLPSEIMSLPDLTCFVKIAGNWAITKLTMKWQTPNLAVRISYKILKKLRLVS